MKKILIIITIVILAVMPFVEPTKNLLIAEITAATAQKWVEIESVQAEIAWLNSRGAVESRFAQWQDEQSMSYQRLADSATLLMGGLMCVLFARGFQLLRHALPGVIQRLDVSLETACVEQEHGLALDRQKKQQATRVVSDLVKQRRKMA